MQSNVPERGASLSGCIRVVYVNMLPPVDQITIGTRLSWPIIAATCHCSLQQPLLF